MQQTCSEYDPALEEILRDPSMAQHREAILWAANATDEELLPEKLRPSNSKALEFSEEELAELDRRLDEYKVEPESAIDATDFKSKIKTGYGI
ncbi:MAG: hypothetical protein H7246_13765 [Phycisphaerae bacterium]|nr:hypothetical protein [Saprospiraceae bacterium]